MASVIKLCKVCGETKEVSRETWVWRTRDGFCGNVCLVCDRLKSKLKAQKIRSTPEGLAYYKANSERARSTPEGRVKASTHSLASIAKLRNTVEGAEKLRAKSTTANAKYRATVIGKEKANIANRLWKITNKEKVIAAVRFRQTAKLQCTPKWLTSEDNFIFEEAYALARLRQKLTRFAWHVDHVVPLRGRFVSGLHVPENIQVIPAIINMQKSNTWPM